MKKPSNVVDFMSNTANMYGCEPCPKCKSRYRAAFKKKDGPHMIECDDCGYAEKLSNPEVFGS